MRQIQAEAWQNQILPQLRTMIDEWMELTDEEAETLVTETQEKVTAQVAAGRVVLVNPYRPEPGSEGYSKERLVKLALGSHEYLLAAIESWAFAIVMRDGLDQVSLAVSCGAKMTAAKDVAARSMGVCAVTPSRPS